MLLIKSSEYDTDYNKSVWTKNLISRIIANPKFAGADGYPAIILQTDFELANKRKSDMGEIGRASCRERV